MTGPYTPTLNFAGLRDVVKTGELAAPGEVRGAGRAVSILADDDLRLGLLVIGDLAVLLGFADYMRALTKSSPLIRDAMISMGY